jgi:succinate dehydrogenase/fumarate reductase flavoprotein subunit
MKRRHFIKSSALGAAFSGTFISSSWSGASRETTNKRGIYREPAKDIPIAGEFDVIVSGGGPAGISAAIEAGRSGAKTLLLEVHGCLGGVWTSGLLSWILDNQNKMGLMDEIRKRLTAMGAQCPIDTGHVYSFDVEMMKVLLEELAQDSNVEVQFHTRVVEAVKDKNKLTHVITESKSGREAWAGKVFIDTTGDGDLAARAGCGFEYGNEDGKGQPMSLLALVGGINFEDIKPYVRWVGDTGSKKRLMELIVNGGVIPSYLNPGLYPIRENLYMMMTNHEYGVKGINATDVSKATLNARRELHKIINGLRSLGGNWGNMRLIATAEQIGVREGRRIHGMYTVSREDLVKGARFDDAVCRVTFGVDVHSLTKQDEGHDNNLTEVRRYNQGIKSKDYDIPLRSLIAKDIGGLMMAGRCISGDFIAHSSYRVTGNSVAMGQAAGRVAALAAKKNKLPQEVAWKETGIQIGG